MSIILMGKRLVLLRVLCLSGGNTPFIDVPKSICSPHESKYPSFPRTNQQLYTHTLTFYCAQISILLRTYWQNMHSR